MSCVELELHYDCYAVNSSVPGHYFSNGRSRRDIHFVGTLLKTCATAMGAHAGRRSHDPARLSSLSHLVVLYWDMTWAKRSSLFRASRSRLETDISRKLKGLVARTLRVGNPKERTTLHVTSDECIHAKLLEGSVTFDCLGRRKSGQVIRAFASG